MNIRNSIHRIVFKCFVGLVLCCSAYAANGQMVSCGKEFFVAQVAPAPSGFFLVSKYAATVHFKFTAMPGYNVSVMLTPNEVYLHTFNYFESIPYSWPIPEVGAPGPGMIINNSLLICADSDIVVHFANMSSQAQDASLIYPITQKNTDTAGFFALGAQGSDGGVNKKLAMIIAHQDSVTLEINAVADIGPYLGGNPFRITMNRGDVFNLSHPIADVSGSTIKVIAAPSPYPITVLSYYGAAYLRFPWNKGDPVCCGDYLLEQTLPLSTYDTVYHYVPFMMAAGLDTIRLLSQTPGIVRVLSAVDQNRIYVDGQVVAQLNRGEMFDTVLWDPHVITASFPIAVNQFAQSWSTQGAGRPNTGIGDPDQLWLSPLKEGIRESIFRGFYPQYNKDALTTLTLIADSGVVGITLNGVDIRNEFTPFAADPRYIYIQQRIDNALMYHLLSEDRVVAYVTTFMGQGGMSYALGDISSALPTMGDTGKVTTKWICDTLTLHGRPWAKEYTWNTGSHKPDLHTRQPGTYWVLSRGGNDCILKEVTDTFHLKEAELPLDGWPDTIICPGDTILLNAFKEYFSHYTWNTGSDSSWIAVTAPGRYIVKAATADCLGIEGSVGIYSPQWPKLALPGDIELCKGEHLWLGVPQDSIRYLWNTGDTVCCILIDSTGFYEVTASNLCDVQLKEGIQVDFYGCDFCLQVPNAFSPNGDGLNDAFHMVSNCKFHFFRMDIYNRWGTLLFSTENLEKGWDGTYKGRAMDAGVYFYQITAEALLGDQQLIRHKGDITLIR